MTETQIDIAEPTQPPAAIMPSKPRAITKWSILALLIMVLGGVLTLSLDQAILQTWAASGRAFPLTHKATIDLQKGESLVWYESPDAVPLGDVWLVVTDSAGDRVKPQVLTSDMSYDLTFGHKCGRAMWRLAVTRPGPHEFACYNHNFDTDSKIPAEDRVVFLKTPDSLVQVNGARNFVKVTGASISMTLVIVCYVLHGLSLRKSKMS